MDDGWRMTDDKKTSAPTIVHTIEDIRTALLNALPSAIRHPSSVILQSAPDAIFYAGALYLLTMFQQAKTEFPNIDAIFILDCADSSAQAISAMQMGHTHIRTRAPEPLRTKLCDIARQLGVTVVTDST